MKVYYWVFFDVLLTLIFAIIAVSLGQGSRWSQLPDLMLFVSAAVVIRPLFLLLSGTYRYIWRYATAQNFITVCISILAGSLFLFLIVKLFLTPAVGNPALILEGSLSLLFLVFLRFFLGKKSRYAHCGQHAGKGPGRRIA